MAQKIFEFYKNNKTEIPIGKFLSPHLGVKENCTNMFPPAENQNFGVFLIGVGYN